MCDFDDRRFLSMVLAIVKPSASSCTSLSTVEVGFFEIFG